MNNRINHLDGLRGLAILLVIVYHAFSRWPNIVPYGDLYQEIPLFKLGWLGVQLFFLISGFVILMSLEKSTNIFLFIFKRWIRLFPAMLIATCLIYFTSGFFYERPDGPPDLISIIPGLTFIEPWWWGKVLGTEVRLMEGVFWSLYVEFKFYIIAAIVYFSLGRNALIICLITLFLSAIITEQSLLYFDAQWLAVAHNIFSEFTFRYFGWFAAGSSFYIYYKNQDKFWLLLGLGVAILSSLSVKETFSLTQTIGALFITSLFVISFFNQSFQTFLQSKILLFFGFISYPLYLIHENAMISIIVKTHGLISGSGLPSFLYPIPAVIMLSTVAYLIVKFIEPIIRNLIMQPMQLIWKIK